MTCSFLRAIELRKMKNWKIRIEYENKTLEVVLYATSYPEAYIAAEIKYPGCIVQSVSEIRETNK